ncbi:S49 family peptidase [Methylococcus capsulatus]|uniref:S49 family peptidase n=1 Tax=Methylococcus capsulatus TaxID=414 RepID=UPI001C531609|nr:S49 family peptidase [Methylococcus capsulatus]QXP89464.1 S49 family peptidase [Methylococcus capsulatus]
MPGPIAPLARIIRRLIGSARARTPADHAAPNTAPALDEESLAGLIAEWAWRTRRKRRLRMMAGIAVVAVIILAATQGAKSLPPRQGYIAVVRIEGEIEGHGLASAERLVPVLREAFASRAQGVILAIDSPGGQPLESERIVAVIDEEKANTKKPVHAVIGNLGASAAYMIALHADRIVAGRYSLVGSIGAVIAAWDFHEILDRLGVRQRVFASGPRKNMLNPFTPMSGEDARRAQDLVDRMGAEFVREFQERREGRLKPGVNYATGEVWAGEDALALGLIDGIGTLETVLRDEFGGLKARDLGPRGGIGGLFSAQIHGFLRSLSGS